MGVNLVVLVSRFMMICISWFGLLIILVGMVVVCSMMLICWVWVMGCVVLVVVVVMLFRLICCMLMCSLLVMMWFILSRFDIRKDCVWVLWVMVWMLCCRVNDLMLGWDSILV